MQGLQVNASIVFSIVLFLQLLHNNIDSVEKKLSGSSGTLTIKCKDFKWLMLDIPQAEDCLGLATSIEQLSNIGMFSTVNSQKFRPP